MKLSDREKELIQKFLAENIRKEEKEELREALDKEAVRKELEFQAKMIDALASSEDSRVRDFIRQGRRSNPLAQILPFSNWMKYAAIIILFVASWFVFQTILFPPNLYAIVDDHSSIYPPDNFQRGEAPQLSRSYKEAMGYYANENYALAYNLFLDLNPQSEKINLYRINCLIELKKHEEADGLLQLLLNSSNEEMKSNAEWYNAINKLLSGNKRQAKNIFKQLAQDQNHLFSARAKEILKVL